MPDAGRGAAASARIAGLADNYNFAPDNYLITPQERVSLFGSGTLEITDNSRFKTTVTYNQRKSEQLLAAVPLAFDASCGDPELISADSIYNPYGRDVNEIFRRMAETGGRSFNQDVRTFAFDGAFEGTFDIGERFFDWEAGYFYGDNKANNTTNGLFQISKVANALGPSMLDGSGTPVCVGVAGDLTTVIDGCVPMNLLGGAGTLTQDMIDYATFTAHDEFYYKQKTYYANVGGDLFDLPGGAMGFSFGIEHRTEFGYDDPDALINSGDTTGNARTATRGGYDVDEAYLELAIPVLADLPFAKLLDFSLATRYSDYSNFGDTLNSKFGFRWKPIDDLMIRGNWSEGFRAPSIAELFAGQADSFPAITDPCAGSLQGTPNTDIPAGCAGVPAYNQNNPQIRITVGGNPDLQPELSTSKTLGFVYSPGFVQGLDISLDWWQVEIDDAIFLQTGQAILDNCYRNGTQAACDLITPHLVWPGQRPAVGSQQHRHHRDRRLRPHRQLPHAGDRLGQVRLRLGHGLHQRTVHRHQRRRRVLAGPAQRRVRQQRRRVLRFRPSPTTGASAPTCRRAGRRATTARHGSCATTRHRTSCAWARRTCQRRRSNDCVRIQTASPTSMATIRTCSPTGPRHARRTTFPVRRTTTCRCSGTHHGTRGSPSA